MINPILYPVSSVLPSTNTGWDTQDREQQIPSSQHNLQASAGIVLCTDINSINMHGGEVGGKIGCEQSVHACSARNSANGSTDDNPSPPKGSSSRDIDGQDGEQIPSFSNFEKYNVIDHTMKDLGASEIISSIKSSIGQEVDSPQHQDNRYRSASTLRAEMRSKSLSNSFLIDNLPLNTSYNKLYSFFCKFIKVKKIKVWKDNLQGTAFAMLTAAHPSETVMLSSTLVLPTREG